MESIEIVGFDLITGLGAPWNLTEGDTSALKIPDTVIFDRYYLNKLGVNGVGDQAEINDRRARVVGLTRDIRSFTTSPYVFTTFKRAQDYVVIDDDHLITLCSSKPPPASTSKGSRPDLKSRLPDNEVFTTAQFSAMTRHYWMFTTGAGIAVLMAAALGLIVGVAVVAQTIYATTMDHIREYGTLKAMGAASSYILVIILWQAIVAACRLFHRNDLSMFVVRNAEKAGPTSFSPGRWR